jgi:hypothetical protein
MATIYNYRTNRTTHTYDINWLLKNAGLIDTIRLIPQSNGTIYLLADLVDHRHYCGLINTADSCLLFVKHKRFNHCSITLLPLEGKPLDISYKESDNA